MGRAPCCDKANVKKGPWSPDEDAKLKSYIEQHGTGGNWIALPQKIGLKRCGKSCRLRWLNYLRPNIKHGGFSEEEDRIICSLYVSIGSRWSIIAAQLPGRTDNDIKNYWNTKLKKKLLGKQRSKPQHQQSRRAAAGSISKPDQTMTNRTNEPEPSSLMATASVPSWQNLTVQAPVVSFNVDDQTEPIRKLLAKLGGRFWATNDVMGMNNLSQFPAGQQVYEQSVYVPVCSSSSSSAMDCGYANRGISFEMVQGQNCNFIGEISRLEEINYGNNNNNDDEKKQQLQGLEFLYGDDQMAGNGLVWTSGFGGESQGMLPQEYGFDHELRY